MNFISKANHNFKIIEDTDKNKTAILSSIFALVSVEKKFLCEWSLKIIDFEKKFKNDRFYWVLEYSAENLISVVPIRVEKYFIFFQKISIATNYYGFFIEHVLPVDIEGFLKFIDKIFVLNLIKSFHPIISAQTNNFKNLSDYKKSQVTAIDKNHYSNLDDFGCYWQSRPSKLRQTACRKLKKIQCENASFILTSKPTAIEIDHYWQIYENSWKQQEPCKDFVNWVLSGESNCFTPHLGILYVDNTPIASQIWFLREQVLYIFKLAQDKNFDKLSPGTLLTKYMAEQLTTQDVKQINFMFGDDEYKKLWMDSVQDIFDVTIYRFSTLRSLANFKQRIRHLIKPTA